MLNTRKGTGVSVELCTVINRITVQYVSDPVQLRRAFTQKYTHILYNGDKNLIICCILHCLTKRANKCVSVHKKAVRVY